MSVGAQALVTATNSLFIYLTAGWYKIAVVNESPTAITGVNASYSLATDGSATTITAVSTDPEGLPLTWSYSVSTGSLTNGGGATATVAQSTNVFTITPTTTEAYAGNFSITFTATDNVNGIATVVSSFTLVFTVPNSRYTELLATAVAASDNNNFTDSSTNNHSLTASGDATAGTLSPYAPDVSSSDRYAYNATTHGGSVYCSGSTPGINYVKSPTHADFGFGTSNFTVECWYRPTERTNTYGRVFQFGNYWYNASTLYMVDRRQSSTKFQVDSYTLGSAILSSTTDVVNGTWYHIAFERNGTTLTLYINGSAESTYNIGTATTPGINGMIPLAPLILER